MNDFIPLNSSDLPSALALLLAAPDQGRPASARHVEDFRAYLREGAVQWEGLRVGPAGAPTGVFLVLILPGRTAIIMVPNPGELGIDPSQQSVLARAGMAALSTRRLHYAQVLLEPEATAKRGLIERAGFQFLAPLHYLERDATYPWIDPPQPASAAWVQYDPTTHAEFAAVIQATYERSLDCPELTGIRPMDDVLAAHQASGRFDPALWELARVQGQSAGCLLLSPASQGNVLEVVYMGVVPSWRGHGVGELLLRRAVARCRATQSRRLTAVVDDRNRPARRLYGRFAMTCVARREAYWYRWRARDG